MIEVPHKKIHIVGIKGAGTSALACILKRQGNDICGSDIPEEFFTDSLLQSCDIQCEDFSDEHIARAPLDRVLYSTAWKDSSEVRTARERALPTQSYPEALGTVFNEGYGIAIAGSHGKTTTTAMTAYILKEAGLDPTAIIGSEIIQYGANALFGRSPYVVIEADEYENKFQYYHPRGLLVTNIDYDHPDFFASSAQYDNVFKNFIEKTLHEGGRVVACGDDEGVCRLQRGSIDDRLVLYGADERFHYAVSDIRIDGPATHYTLLNSGNPMGTYSLSLLGAHNATNALGAIALCDTLGLVDSARCAKILEQFRGTARRFEYKGRRGCMIIYDDFAHHPREVRVTLESARTAFPGKRIWCVFGSHTYSRTKALLHDFARSFGSIDWVLILDIYGSAREYQGAIGGNDLAAAINMTRNNAQYVGTHERALGEIVDHIDEIDVLITMGAGDVWRIAERLLDHS